MKLLTILLSFICLTGCDSSFQERLNNDITRLETNNKRKDYSDIKGERLLEKLKEYAQSANKTTELMNAHLLKIPSSAIQTENEDLYYLYVYWVKKERTVNALVLKAIDGEPIKELKIPDFDEEWNKRGEEYGVIQSAAFNWVESKTPEILRSESELKICIKKENQEEEKHWIKIEKHHLKRKNKSSATNGTIIGMVTV